MDNAAQFHGRYAFGPVLACFLGALLLAGCGKQSSNSGPRPGPASNLQVCFECKGKGKVPCTAPGCTNGEVDCPGPCVRLGKGVWVKPARSSDPNEYVQLITVGGRRLSVSSHYQGVIYVPRDDGGWDMKPCPICNGKTKVDCPVCKGTGKVICPVCNGKKYIPAEWTPTNNPWFNSQPDVMRLKDGRVFLGRVEMAIGDDRTVITRDHQTLYLKASDILPAADAKSPAARTTSPK